MTGRMEWVHPDIGLNELLVFVRAFVDILVLASGCQSSGEPAYWEPESTKKALQWAIFFEDVLKKLPASEDGKGSKQALDMALFKLTSDPLFPQGLRQLSSATLAESRKLLLGSLLQAVDLRDEQLTSVLTVACEMDCDDSHDNFKQAVPSAQGEGAKENSNNSLLDYAIEEITKRHLVVACTASLEKGLGVLVDLVTPKKEVRIENEIWKISMNSASTSRHDNSVHEFELWGQWRNNGLLYLLDAKTLHMVSGASLIFSGTKLQWFRALELLRGPIEELDDSKMSEIVELCFLGLASKGWNYSIRTFMSASYPNISFSRMWHDLQDSLKGKVLPPHIEEEIVDLKRLELEEYLLQLLNRRVQLLWKVPPVLAASTLTVRSAVFALYVDEIQKHINSDAGKTKCSNSYWDSQKYLEGEIGERICCLYIFMSNLHNDTSANTM